MTGIKENDMILLNIFSWSFSSDIGNIDDNEWCLHD